METGAGGCKTGVGGLNVGACGLNVTGSKQLKEKKKLVEHMYKYSCTCVRG